MERERESEKQKHTYPIITYHSAAFTWYFQALFVRIEVVYLLEWKL